MPKIKFLSIALLFIGMSFFVLAQVQEKSKADSIIGLYSIPDTGDGSGESKLRVYKTENGNYRMQVVWVEHPLLENGEPKLDIKNSNKELRKTRADQIILVQDLSYNSAKNQWEGKVYNPLNGKYYNSYMEFEDKHILKVRGYIGVSLFGKTMHWKKIE